MTFLFNLLIFSLFAKISFCSFPPVYRTLALDDPLNMYDGAENLYLKMDFKNFFFFTFRHFCMDNVKFFNW